MKAEKKQCNTCKQFLTLDNSVKAHKSKWTGQLIKPQKCQKCHNEYSRQWRVKNPGYHANYHRMNRDSVLAYQRKRYRKKKEEIANA